ncbi:Cytochrome P450 monooxygenase [Pseudocercospora fuligena]|uniref:Cytochrome P450 monooxygenase n=1 Tax=Pseudocercospora fuligena TaxID=685502 RepID=A0A8H6RUJ6_9PEZI|nr:Cytochrome P450 monooxygenase [Pseudocercospora fuligena]
MYSFFFVAILLTLGLAWVYGYSILRSKLPNGTKLLPGPPGQFLVGNLKRMPKKHYWLKFLEWSKQYGPIYQLSFFGKPNIIIGSEKIANDLLRDRGSIYSSREQRPALVKLLGGSLRPLMWPHDHTFQQGRKLWHQLCSPKACVNYQDTITIEALRALQDLIKRPEKYEEWFSRYAGGIIFRLGFGKVLQGGGDPMAKRIHKEIQNFGKVSKPGAYLVDLFPKMMWFPRFLAPWKAELEAMHVEERQVMRDLLNDVRQEMEEGTAVDCWEKYYIEHMHEYDLSEDQGAYVIGTLFEAGIHTTSVAMQSFVHAMVLHPGEYKKLQDELEDIVGADRLPTFDHMPSLPRVRATVKEVLRWRPVVAGGISHFLERDDTYEGQYIPAGSNVHACQLAMSRDPELYPCPEEFIPDRWLDRTYSTTYREPLSQYPNIQHYMAFGNGRRICPGMHIAERSLTLLVAQIAWACDVRKKVEGIEEVSVPLESFKDAMFLEPEMFQFHLTARSHERMELIAKATELSKEGDPLRYKRRYR